MAEIRVLIAEDHKTVREGLKMIVNAQEDMVVIGEAGDGREAIRLARELIPDVLLMDISMPGLNGLKAAAKLKRIATAIKILTVTRHTDDAVFSQVNILEDGRIKEIAMIGRESGVGFSAVSSPRSPAYWTQILIAGRALKIKTEIFRQEFLRSDAIRSAIYDHVNNHIAQMSQKIICSNYHLIEEQFCSWLLMINDRSKDSRLQLTHDRIAGYLGVNRPTITHIAQVLREKSIIAYTRGKISILNRCELEKSACGCYRAMSRIF